MKKGLALVFTILGAVGLVYGIFMLFNGEVTDSNPWIAAVLGVIFFTSGMGLMRSTGSSGGA